MTRSVIFFASQLMHGLKRVNGIKRYSTVGNVDEFADGEDGIAMNNSHLTLTLRHALFSAEFLDHPVDVFFGADTHFSAPGRAVTQYRLPLFLTKDIVAGHVAKKFRAGTKFAFRLLVDKFQKLRRHGQIECDGHGDFPLGSTIYKPCMLVKLGDS